MSNLFLTTASMTAVVPSAAEATRWKLAAAAGGASTMCNKLTAAAPAAALKITDSTSTAADGNPVAWYSDQIAAVLIAGPITASFWTKESANTANVAPSLGVYRCDSLGVELATIVDPSANQGAAEMATTAGGVSDVWTITTTLVIDTQIQAGERIKAGLFIDNAVDQGGAGSMAAGANAQFWINGPTGSAGQAQIAFTETLSSLVAGFVARPPVTITRVAVRRSMHW